MPTLPDARFEALRAQGFTGASSDMLLQWLQANGATSGAISDAWREMLDANGFSTGNRNDDWYALLGSLGYTGAMNDRELGFWLNGGTLTRFTFNGTDQYATMPEWDTLGNYAVYGSASYTFSGASDDIIDLPPPVSEFGRVGVDYHDGYIAQLRLIDSSPIQDTVVKKSSVGTIGPFDMTGGSVAFDYIHAADEDIIVGFLSSAAGVLTLSADAENLVVDGVAYAGDPVTVGKHYTIAFDTTGGTLTTINSTQGMQNLEIYGSKTTNPPSLVWAAGSSEYMLTGAGSHEMEAQRLGDGIPAFTTPVGMLLPDFEGLYYEIEENTAPWYGARRVENLFNDKVTPTGAASITSTGTNEYLIENLIAGNSNRANFQTDNEDPDIQAVFSLEVKADVAGNVGKDIRFRIFASGQPERTYTLTDDWVRVTTQVTTTNGTLATAWLYGSNTNNATGCMVRFPQTESVEGKTNQAPSAYIDPLDIKFYSNLNGNTVDANGVVTVAEGAPLTVAPSLASRGWSDEGTTQQPTQNTSVFDSLNMDDTEGAIYLEVNSPVANNILDGFLAIVGANYQLDDGTTQVTRPFTADTWQKVGVAYGSGQMSITVDGVASADVPYDGTLLSGALDLFRTSTDVALVRDVQRWALGYAAAKAKILERMA